MDSMALAFSQTFLALASGVYTRAPILEQRLRADVRLTKMGKGPFYLLVVCMFLYAFVVLVFTVVALNIFRRRDVREVQVRLMPKD
jgi:ABC-type Na+ efflux pump permease subunit